jgi:hypothetical protein
MGFSVELVRDEEGARPWRTPASARRWCAGLPSARVARRSEGRAGWKPAVRGATFDGLALPPSRPFRAYSPKTYVLGERALGVC